MNVKFIKSNNICVFLEKALLSQLFNDSQPLIIRSFPNAIVDPFLLFYFVFYHESNGGFVYDEKLPYVSAGRLGPDQVLAHLAADTHLVAMRFGELHDGLNQWQVEADDCGQ